MVRLELHLGLGGWDDADAERYPALWTIGDLAVHEVRDGFPRLDPATFPAGVTVRRYQLAQSAITEFRVHDAKLVEIPPSVTGERA